MCGHTRMATKVTMAVPALLTDGHVPGHRDPKLETPPTALPNAIRQASGRTEGQLYVLARTVGSRKSLTPTQGDGDTPQQSHATMRHPPGGRNKSLKTETFVSAPLPSPAIMNETFLTTANVSPVLSLPLSVPRGSFQKGCWYMKSKMRTDVDRHSDGREHWWRLYVQQTTLPPVRWE